MPVTFFGIDNKLRSLSCLDPLVLLLPKMLFIWLSNLSIMRRTG